MSIDLKLMKRTSAGIAVLLLWIPRLALGASADCEGLISANVPDTRITLAEMVTNGTFTEESFGTATSYHGLAHFCRVVAVIRPTADSEIGIEVWLPEQWNGRYYQSGSGGFAGAILYVGLVQGLRHGFAVANTDAGHTEPGAAWADRKSVV